MIGSRTRPLLVLLALGGALLLVRLYQVQVGEHTFWAREAARLVHTGEVLPYERGTIRDAEGRALAHDKKTYTLALHYRDFRRGHALGQVAHARSLLEERAVPLSVTGLADWARALVHLTPAQLEAFGRGAELTLRDVVIPGDPEPRRSYRRHRAADAGFYVRRLLDLDTREWKALQKRVKRGEDQRSYLALAADVRLARGPRQSADELEAHLATDVEASIVHLRRLAERLELGPPRPAASDGFVVPVDPLAALVGELEEARRWVEDATASKLFLEAAGFAPGRLGADLLVGEIDLTWIRRLLAWDEARLGEWALRARAGWRTSWRDQFALPRLIAGLRADASNPPAADDVLDGLVAVLAPRGALEAALDGRPTAWRESGRLAALDDLAELFGLAGVFERGGLLERGPVLPFEEPDVRGLELAEPWLLFDRMAAVLPEAPVLGPELERILVRHGRAGEPGLQALLAGLLDEWDARLQRALRAELARLHERARGEGELSDEGRLVIDAPLRERAVERADYYLKDYGTRPRFLVKGEPDYEIVWWPTRHPEWFAGFVARESRQRVTDVLPGDVAPLASELVGRVSSFDVSAFQRQRSGRVRLAQLKNEPDRDQDEEVELRELVGTIVLQDEKRGVSGIEGYFNAELSGANGYRESWGLEETMGKTGRDRGPVTEPIDGQDVWLTLEAELQRAAERTLREPRLVPDPLFDHDWYANPVGAIVLLTPEGDVLAAASEPGLGSDVAPGTPGQRGVLVDRTLRQPLFQPPGSVFKPFVAAEALSSLDLDPAWTVDCGPIERGGAGYKDVRCHSRYGHGTVDLHAALVQSCNAYFAALGERLEQRDFRRIGALFGFGQPTGVRTPPPWSAEARRGGLHEEPGWPGLDRRWQPIEHRLAGNGLGVVQATPMQVARAMAGLATGVLPEVRLASRVGERVLPREPGERIDIPAADLALLRAALIGVAAEPNGTAHKALGLQVLGTAVAVKTGSADLTGRRDDIAGYRARKHTWVAGWLPPEDPICIFVVFVNDTSTTSSHGAVYVAQALLQQPEVVTWLTAHGVRVDAPAWGGSGR